MEFTVSVISHSQKFDLVSTIFTTRKQSLRRLCFHRCLSVHRCVAGVCMVGGMHGMHDSPEDTMRYGQ